MFSFLRKPQAQVKVNVIARERCRLRMEEWRADPTMVKAARRLLDSSEFISMLEILRTECFINYQLSPRATMEDRAVMQARGEGYCTALANLEALGDYIMPENTIEPTFESAELQTETQ